MFELRLIVYAEVLVYLTVIFLYALRFDRLNRRVHAIDFDLGMRLEKLLDLFVLFIECDTCAAFSTRPAILLRLSRHNDNLESIAQTFEALNDASPQIELLGVRQGPLLQLLQALSVFVELVGQEVAKNALEGHYDQRSVHLDHASGEEHPFCLFGDFLSGRHHVHAFVVVRGGVQVGDHARALVRNFGALRPLVVPHRLHVHLLV